MKSHSPKLPTCLMALTVVLALGFALCGCQQPVKMSESQAQKYLEEELSDMIPEAVTGEFSKAKPIVTIYDMDIPSDNNGTYFISCSCSIDMGKTPKKSYWKKQKKRELLIAALQVFNESAEGITRLGTRYNVSIKANVSTAFYYDADRWPYTVESDAVFKYTPDLSSASLVYDANEGASSSSGSGSSTGSGSGSSSSSSNGGSSTYEGPTGTFVETDDGDVVQFEDSGSVTQYNENGVTTFNPDGSKEWTDGWGTVVQDVDGDGNPDRVSYDSGETWVPAN